jgi:hypothetical protein
LLDTQLTVRPVRIDPPASAVIAVNVCVLPTIIGVVGEESVIVATGAGVTVMEEVPVFPSLVAVTVVEPTAWGVTSPFTSTVATTPSPDDHVTARPISGLLFASLVSAESCRVKPIAMLAAPGVTATVATGTGVTVSVALPLFPSLVAVIAAMPGAIELTTPPLDTVATEVLSETHSTVRPVSVPPFASRVAAVA